MEVCTILRACLDDVFHSHAHLYEVCPEIKGCSHGKIATAIYFSQLMNSMGFSVHVAIASCEHLH